MTTWDDLISSGLVDVDTELAPHTTYKLGGPARLFASVDSIESLDAIGGALAADPVPVLVLGRGSNILVADTGFAGLVLALGGGFTGISIGSDGVVSAGAAAPLPRLARAAATKGRGGLEWFVGVPGSVGGAIRQNAGCFGSEVVDVLVSCEVLTLGSAEVRTLCAADLDLAYRRSNLAPQDVVLAARFATCETDPEASSGEMRRITRWRREHQPGGTLNAGSVFKNPPGDRAGAIIDRLGLKGHAVGLVRVSPRHANFIEAAAGANAADVRALIDDVLNRVLAQTGTLLEPEIEFVGFGQER